MFEITTTDRPALRLAALPHKGPYHQIGDAFGRLFGALKGIAAPSALGPMVGVYYDNPAETPQAELRAHAGIVLPDDVPVPEGMDVVHLPAGPHAVLAHQGPYETLPAAYDQLYSDWLPGSGRTPADSPASEVYLNSPMDTPPADLRTQVCLPLA